MTKNRGEGAERVLGFDEHNAHAHCYIHSIKEIDTDIRARRMGRVRVRDGERDEENNAWTLFPTAADNERRLMSAGRRANDALLANLPVREPNARTERSSPSVPWGSPGEGPNTRET